MTKQETKKIEKLLEKYKELFEATNMDVCRSVKGRWYFFRDNVEYGYYECFREFASAKELIHMIHNELMLDMSDTVDASYKLPKYKHEDLGDVIEDIAER